MIHIIIGSTLGNAEFVAEHLADILTEKSLSHTLYPTPAITDIPNEDIWLIITSTHGAGAYPENIQPFMKDLQNQPPNMQQVRFAVIAIGDSSYDTFCAAGKHAYDLLLDIGATPLTERIDIDVISTELPEDIAEKWLYQHLINPQ